MCVGERVTLRDTSGLLSSVATMNPGSRPPPAALSCLTWGAWSAAPPHFPLSLGEKAARTPGSLAYKPQLPLILLSLLGCDGGIPTYPEPPAQLTSPFSLPPSPAPVSCFIDCLAWLPPIRSSQASSARPSPQAHRPSLPVSAHVCLYLPVAGTPEDPRCLTECGAGSGCLPDSRDQVVNPVAVFPGPASSDGFPNS